MEQLQGQENMIIQLDVFELEDYRAALDADDAIRNSPHMPRHCLDWGYRVLAMHGIEGHPDKVTVQFNHQTGHHLYELHYKI